MVDDKKSVNDVILYLLTLCLDHKFGIKKTYLKIVHVLFLCISHSMSGALLLCTNLCACVCVDVSVGVCTCTFM